MGKRAPLIVIEGVDGVGKNTQAKALVEKLTVEGHPAQMVSFPRYDIAPWGPLLSEYLHGKLGDPMAFHPKLSGLPYSMDRAGASPFIKQLLESGTLVILDRWTTSNMGFQGGRLKKQQRKEYLDWLETLEYETLGCPREDLVLFLDLSAEANERLIAGRSNESRVRDNHESNKELLAQARESYRNLVDVHKHWKRIDVSDETLGIKPVEEITALLLREIYKLI